MQANEEIKGLKDEICGLVSNLQTEIKSRGTEVDDTISKMAEQASKLAEDLQKINARIEAEEKSRQNLEVIIARGGRKDGEESFGDSEYKSQFNAKIRRKGNIEIDATQREAEAIVNYYMPNAKSEDRDYAVKTIVMSVGSQPTDGYFVPLDSIRGISQRVFESTPMRQVATVITTARESVPWLIDDEEADSGWTSEFKEISTNTDVPGLGEIVISTHEQYAYPKATKKSLDDASINMESWLENKIAMKFTREDNKAFTTGNNVNRPQGFLTLDSWTSPEVYERGKLGTYTTAASLTIADTDLIDVQSGLLEDYQSNANFMMHRLTWAELLKLKDGEDRALINPQLIFQGAIPQLLGRPVLFSGDMAKPTAGVFTAGQKVIAYGDFREGYLIVDRMGINILRDELTSKGFVKWYVTRRVGGAVVNYQAIKILDIKA